MAPIFCIKKNPINYKIFNDEKTDKTFLFVVEY